MSEFLKQAEIRTKLGLISRIYASVLIKAYEEKDDEIKKIYDENAELYLNNRENKMANDIKSIKKNLQFFFWLTIISIVISVLAVSLQ
jgi:hypothetical protein